jgi:hypothetical protein
VAYGYRDGEHAVPAPLRAYAEVDEVIPVERRQQERGRQPGSVNARSAWPLTSKCGTLYLAPSRRRGVPTGVYLRVGFHHLMC